MRIDSIGKLGKAGIALGTLGICTVLYSLFAPDRQKIENPDTNPHQIMSYVNLSTDKYGGAPFRVIDEDRDGVADYIATDVSVMAGPSSPQNITFVRTNGFKPSFKEYRFTPLTKIMTPEIQREANAALANQRYLTEAILRAK
jgi:hypothetical protein